MKKQNLYKELKMKEFYDGDSFIVDRNNKFISVIENIDDICTSENRNCLGEKWNKIDFVKCSELLKNAFNFDLAHPNSANMTADKAGYYHDFIVSKFTEIQTACYTNWSQSPWESKNGASWNPITENTFDMAIVFC
jgi:hypothetical protein